MSESRPLTPAPVMEEDKNVNELRDKMEQLLSASDEKLKNVQRVREEKEERVQQLVQENAKKKKRCDELQQRINVAKGKSAQLKAYHSKLEEQDDEFVRVLKHRKRDGRQKDQKTCEIGLEMLATLNQLVCHIAEKHRKYKSPECVQNGTNTLIFQTEKLKDQIQPYQDEIEDLKGKIAKK